MKTRVIGILDDTSSNLLDIENYLISKKGIQAFVTEFIEEGLEWVERDKVDLFVCDLNLDGYPLNGDEVLLQARKINELIPLACYTYGVPKPEVVKKCRDHNIEFLDKESDEVRNLSENFIEIIARHNSTFLREESKSRIEDEQLLSLISTESLGIIEDLKSELINELKEGDSDQLINFGQTERLTVVELIQQIEDGTPLGNEYLKSWTKLKTELKKFGKF